MPSTVDANWVTAAATVVLAIVTGIYVYELRAGHARSIEPLLHWQDPLGLNRMTPGAGAGPPMWVEWRFVVANYGAGHARLLDWTCTDDNGTPYVVTGDDGITPVGKGHTLPPGVTYTWLFQVPAITAGILAGITKVTLKLRYADVESRHVYETFAEFSLTDSALGSGHRSFLRRDERPARQRIVKQKRTGGVVCGPSNRT